MSSLITLVTKALKSKTLITNYAALVAATLTLWLGSDVIASHPEVAGVMTSALAGVNVLLRLLTNKPLEDK